jgi:hypothetical protein
MSALGSVTKMWVSGVNRLSHKGYSAASNIFTTPPLIELKAITGTDLGSAWNTSRLDRLN